MPNVFVERIVNKGDIVFPGLRCQVKDQEGKLQGYVYLSDGRLLNEKSSEPDMPG